jgi:hypothetical protein
MMTPFQIPAAVLSASFSAHFPDFAKSVCFPRLMAFMMIGQPIFTANSRTHPNLACRPVYTDTGPSTYMHTMPGNMPSKTAVQQCKKLKIRINTFSTTCADLYPNTSIPGIQKNLLKLQKITVVACQVHSCKIIDTIRPGLLQL